MALTRFPVETDQPTIEVTLPVGTHILELVVEDSTGLRSAPDTVTITVEPALAEITGIDPASGMQGREMDGVISGVNLDGATEVTFAGEGVTAEIMAGGTDTELPVTITIDRWAAEGSRSFTVVTPSGSAESPPHVVFTVAEVAKPEITGINPASGMVASEFEARITGTNLQDVQAVKFEGTGIKAKVLPGGTPTEVPIVIGIAATAPLGSQRFVLITEDGQEILSPPHVVFTVTAVVLPEITGISPDAGVRGFSLDATITGANLLGAREVRFSGTGITAKILPGGTDEKFPVHLTIDGRATAGERSFTLVTPAGTADSPRGVVFTVVSLPVPTREPIPVPTREPIPVPTREPIPVPTREPIPVPTREPIPVPTREPIPVPTREPIPVPTREPIPVPTREPIPVPTRLPTPTRFEPSDFPGRTVTEVSGIGPTYAERLEANGVTNLAELASMEPARASEVLGVSEVRAMTLIDEARRLLRE